MKNSIEMSIRVGREELVQLLTCPICNKIFKDPMNITECLHIFCNKCIYKKITEEDLSSCPVCNTYLGCAPLDKLRPDHNWSSIRAQIVPSLRKARKEYELANREDEELEFVDGEAEQVVPARIKERSLSSFLSKPNASNRSTTIITRRRKAIARKVIPSRGSTVCIEKPRKSMEDPPENSNFSMTPSKTAQHNKQISSAVESSKQQMPTKGTERTRRTIKPLERMNDLLHPLNCLEESADTKSSKSTLEGLFSKARDVSKGKGNDSGNRSKIYDDADDDEIEYEIEYTPPSAPVRARRMTRGRPKKVVAAAELNVAAQTIIDSRSSQHEERIYPIWLGLVSSDNQEGDEPQKPLCYLMIKDVSLPVSYIKKYLVRKLELNCEDEVEISLWGEPLLPSLELNALIDLWLQTSPTSGKLSSAMVGDSAKEFVMLLSYARKSPAS